MKSERVKIKKNKKLKEKKKQKYRMAEKSQNDFLAVFEINFMKRLKC
jgi:hypothetical protein